MGRPLSVVAARPSHRHLRSTESPEAAGQAFALTIVRRTDALRGTHTTFLTDEAGIAYIQGLLAGTANIHGLAGMAYIHGLFGI